MSFSAQTLMESMDIPLEADIPLPYGLSLKISMVDGAEEMCNTANELQALQGLLGICQGVLLTLSEVKIPLASLILVANERLGLILSLKEVGPLEDIIANTGLTSITDFLDSILHDFMVEINSRIPGVNVQYIQFEEIVPLWWKIVNSKMIYAMRAEYQQTNYSALNNLDALVFGE